MTHTASINTVPFREGLWHDKPEVEIPAFSKNGVCAGVSDQSDVLRNTMNCEQCNGQFIPRTGSGGRLQRFCSASCRQAFHADARQNLDAQRSQRSPTCNDGAENSDIPATESKATPAATAGVVGTVIRNGGGENFLIPEFDLRHVDQIGREMAGETDDKPQGVQFDWHLSRDSVVLPSQQAVAIYWNPDGDLVLRQEATWDRDDDDQIIIPIGSVGILIDRLCDMAGIPSAGK